MEALLGHIVDFVTANARWDALSRVRLRLRRDAGLPLDTSSRRRRSSSRSAASSRHPPSTRNGPGGEQASLSSAAVSAGRASLDRLHRRRHLADADATLPERQHSRRTDLGALRQLERAGSLNSRRKPDGRSPRRFVGIKSPNPFWLASAPPTDKEYKVRARLRGRLGRRGLEDARRSTRIVNVNGPRYGAIWRRPRG